MLNLPKDKRYLLACSYGPDSMALFDMLVKENYIFDVAHVNYGLRKEADQETSDLKAYSEKQNIPCHILKINDNLGTNNLENKCRKISYAFSAELDENCHFESVLIAHHQDDLLETYLMQKKRKNLVKYYGISKETTIFGVNIVRPLLSYSKQDLLDYCHKNKVPFSIDFTNNEDHFLRNKIRHQIVNKLRVDERNELLRKIDNDNKKLEDIFNTLDSVDLHDVKTLLSLDNTSFCYAINRLFFEVNQSRNLSKELCLEIRKILLSDKPNVSLNIHRSYSLVKSYDVVSFQKKLNKVCFSYVIDQPSILDTPYFYLDFTKEYSNRNVKDDDFPLNIRNADKSDSVKIKDYICKVNRLFIDWKMPTELRKRWPVIVNRNNEVIYIPRYRKDFKGSKNLNFYVKV